MKPILVYGRESSPTDYGPSLESFQSVFMNFRDSIDIHDAIPKDHICIDSYYSDGDNVLVIKDMRLEYICFDTEFFDDKKIKYVVFEDCEINYCQFFGILFEKCIFSNNRFCHCTIYETSFIDCMLDGNMFYHCILHPMWFNSELRNTFFEYSEFPVLPIELDDSLIELIGKENIKETNNGYMFAKGEIGCLHLLHSRINLDLFHTNIKGLECRGSDIILNVLEGNVLSGLITQSNVDISFLGKKLTDLYISFSGVNFNSVGEDAVLKQVNLRACRFITGINRMSEEQKKNIVIEK